MFFLKSDELHSHIDNIIHRETQQHHTHFDLTVDKIYNYTKPGALDFGGSEFKPASKELIKPEKHEEDNYGWWNLSKGHYHAVMNEQLTEVKDTTAFIGLHSHAREVGLIANTNVISSKNNMEPLAINFVVPHPGCNIKENARFAVLYLLAS